MVVYDRLRHYAAPLVLTCAIAAVPGLAIAQKSSDPQVTPTPTEQRNNAQANPTKEMNERRDTMRQGSGGENVMGDARPQSRREQTNPLGSSDGQDRQEAMNPDARKPGQEPLGTSNDPTPEVTPTPPAERNVEQKRD